MVAVSFLQSRQIMFEVDKYIPVYGSGVQANTSFNYTLLNYASSDGKYFIEVDWKFRISKTSGTVVLNKISSYVYMVKKIFRGYSTTPLDIEAVVDDSFKRFEEEFNIEKDGTEYAAVSILPYDKTRITEKIEAFIQNDIMEKNLF